MPCPDGSRRWRREVRRAGCTPAGLCGRRECAGKGSIHSIARAVSVLTCRDSPSWGNRCGEDGQSSLSLRKASGYLFIVTDCSKPPEFPRRINRLRNKIKTCSFLLTED